MRDILFKAKRTDTGEWVEGYYGIKGKGTEVEEHCIITSTFNTSSDSNYFYFTDHVVDKDTICQYTGLTDKNGNKVWENDIVKHHFEECYAPIRFGKYQSCFDNTKTQHIGFHVDWGRKQALRKDLGYWVNMVECDIVGNALDNPELLDRETN